MSVAECKSIIRETVSTLVEGMEKEELIEFYSWARSHFDELLEEAKETDTGEESEDDE